MRRDFPEEHVAKQELYLLQFTSGCVSQPRARPTQVMRCQLVDRSFRGELADDRPDNLLGHALTPDSPRSVHATKQSSGGQSCVLQPNVNDRFHPIRHRYRPRVTGLPHEIDNGPMLFSLLKVREVQLHSVMPPQTTGEQHSQKSPVTFALPSLGIGSSPKCFALFRG
jgi:hypothetical protein